MGCGCLLAALVAGLTESYYITRVKKQDSADDAMDRIKRIGK